MNKKEFLYDTKRLVYKEAIKGLNQSLGQSKTAQASLGMLVNVPLEIELRKVETLPKITKKFKSLARNAHMYLKHDEGTIVLSFFYTTDRELPKLYKSIEKNTHYFTYLYFRELLMLSRGYNTYAFYKKAKAVIQANSSIPVEQCQAVMNIACYISITNFISDVYSLVGKSSEFEKISKYEAYDSSYKNKDVFKILKAILPGITTDSFEEFHTCESEFGATAFSDNKLVNDEYDAIITDLGESVETTFKSTSKGSATASIFGTEFEANTKLKTGWFKKLKKTLQRIVYYRTNDFESTWGSLNSTYRHKFKSPKAQYKSTELELVLSIDHSGSIEMEELARIAGVIKKHGKSIANLTILIHDTEITKIFTLKPSEIDLEGDAFKKALLTRYNAGGTSHYHVFKWLVENTTDMSKLLYLSYSDNCSDIPESYAKFPTLRDANMVFVSTIDNPVNITGTTDITLE